MSEVFNADEIMIDRLERMKEPHSKFCVAKWARALGVKIISSIREEFGANCIFETKGSLFDDDIHHISDIDILIFIESGVHPSEALKHVLKMFEFFNFSFMYRDTNGCEFVSSDLFRPNQTQQTIETICASFPLRMGTNTLPFDLTFTTCQRGRVQSIDNIIGKLHDNLKAGKFDKALQRMRPLLGRICESRVLHDRLTDAMNNRTGFIRFVHKQLQLSVDNYFLSEAVSELGIKEDELEGALAVAKKANNFAAKSVLEEFLVEIKKQTSDCNHAKDLKYALAVLDVNEKALETDE